MLLACSLISAPMTSAALKNLHWLRVAQHIQFKLNLITYKVLHMSVPVLHTFSATALHSLTNLLSCQTQDKG